MQKWIRILLDTVLCIAQILNKSNISRKLLIVRTISQTAGLNQLNFFEGTMTKKFRYFFFKIQMFFVFKIQKKKIPRATSGTSASMHLYLYVCMYAYLYVSYSWSNGWAEWVFKETLEWGNIG